MASRSSGGSGLVVTIAILGVACLALFILTIVFLSKYQAANRTLTQMNDDINDIVRPNERNGDQVARIKSIAIKEKQSVVGYLSDAYKTTMEKVTGTPTDTVATLTETLDKEGVTGVSLIAALRDRKNEVEALNAKMRQADQARTTALADLQNEVDRNKQLTESHHKTVQAMNASIDAYKAEVETYRLAVGQAKTDMERDVEKAREEKATVMSALGEENRKLENTVLALKNQIAKMNTVQAGSLMRPKAEESLVDAEIIAINQASNNYTINRGRLDKIVLGMSFAVYPDATALRVDPKTGEYPRPKATIEVTNVGETTSMARMTTEVRGNPIVRGDVLANAVYDPAKVYTFLVYGNFDTNGDGIATGPEADDIRAMINAWGGKTVNELSGNVDFLILGDRPLLPAQPGVNDLPEVVLNYMRLDEIAQRYDTLLDQATATSLPILNQNRLYTLIGRRAGSR